MPRLLAALVVLAALARPAAAAGSGTRDQLVIGVSAFPSTFNPMLAAEVPASYVFGMTMRSLVGYDKNWQLICMLCTELPTLENGRAKIENLPGGKKGIAVTFTLQPGATWGDGVPVTTDDVLFTWEVGRNPKTGVPEADPYRHVTRIDVIDSKTFTFHLDQLRYDFDAYLSWLLIPAHIERKNFTDPATYREHSAYDADTTDRGLYFGPYRITRVVPGEDIVLEPNPTWYGKKPYFKRIVVRTIENTAALEANLLAGSIDYIPGEEGLSLDQALAFEKRHGDRFNVIYKPGLIYEHVDLNLDNPILEDKRVRQALLYAVDRATISQQLFAGKQPVANSFASPLDWIADSDLPHYAYDPVRAAALLDAAGWARMKDGVRVNKDGKPLQLELMTVSGNHTRETIELVLQSYWRKVGIDVRIHNQPARVLIGQTLRKRLFSGMVLIAWLSSPEVSQRSILDCHEIPTAANNYAGQNDSGFCDPEADSLIDRIDVELDRTKRKALWDRLQEIYMDELPALPLYFRADPYVIPKWLTGIEPTGTTDLSTEWVEDWRAR